MRLRPQVLFPTIVPVVCLCVVTNSGPTGGYIPIIPQCPSRAHNSLQLGALAPKEPAEGQETKGTR